MIPLWLHDFSILYLCAGLASALVILWDEWKHPPQIWIMRIVWPVTALFGTVGVLRLYDVYGRTTDPPFAASVAKGALHCGAGCTLGDVIAEWSAFLMPTILAWFGWHSLFSEKLFAVWTLDYLLAFVLGIAFQYFTIAPMRGLSFQGGVYAAVKADLLSLTAWQVGMYGFMAIMQFYVFRDLFHERLEANMPEFWFMMQLAMLAGFATSYPVNWWLVRSGRKEAM